MTRASEMCACGSERGYCDCGTCPRPDECLACHRLIRDDGSCGCSEGCSPAGARAAEAFGILFWLVGAAIVVVLVGLAVFGGAR